MSEENNDPVEFDRSAQTECRTGSRGSFPTAKDSDSQPAFCGYSCAAAMPMHENTHETVTVHHASASKHRQKRKIVLRVSVQDKPAQIVELTRTRVTLGRSRSNHVVLEHESVSGAHAELQQIDQRIELVDLGSHNGSWVSLRRVSRGEVLPGDEIRLGDVRITLVSFDEVDIPISSEHRLGELWGSSDEMREVFAQLLAFAASELNLLITGETGTGKELAARAVHAASARAARPLEVVDCGKLVPTLAASTLFGHVRGAFTGADRAAQGSFELAHGGTIFLDEVGELSPQLQLMLLRVLDRGEFTRIGEHRPRAADVRVVAATHRNLATMVAEGAFREDLYFRLVEGDVELPPLRTRKGDILLLAQRFVQGADTPAGELQLTPGALRMLERHAWPGNVRELRNVLRRAAVMATAAKRTQITEADLRMLPRRSTTPGDLGELVRLGSYVTILDAVDRAVLARALDEHGGVVSHAATTLGISRRRYRQRMIELGLVPASAAKDEDGE